MEHPVFGQAGFGRGGADRFDHPRRAADIDVGERVALPAEGLQGTGEGLDDRTGGPCPCGVGAGHGAGDLQARHLRLELRQLGDVSVERNRGIVAVVGAGLSASGASIARAVAALDGLRIHMLSLSSSGINLTAVIDGDQLAVAMQRLHAAFFADA